MLREKLKRYYESLYKDFRVSKQGKVIYTDNFKGLFEEITQENLKNKREKKVYWVWLRLVFDQHVLILFNGYILNTHEFLSKILGKDFSDKFLSIILKKNKDNLLFNIYLMFFFLFFFYIFVWIFVLYIIFCNFFMQRVFVEDIQKIKNNITFLGNLKENKDQVFVGEHFPFQIKGETFLSKFSAEEMLFFIEQIKKKELISNVEKSNLELLNGKISLNFKQTYFGNYIYKNIVPKIKKNYNFFYFKYLGKYAKEQKQYLKSLLKNVNINNVNFFDNLIDKFFDSKSFNWTECSFEDWIYFLISNCKWIYYSNNYIYVVFDQNFVYFRRDFLIKIFGKDLILGSKQNFYLNFRNFPLSIQKQKNFKEISFHFIRKFKNKYYSKLSFEEIVKKKKRRKRNLYRGFAKYHLKTQKKFYDFRLFKYAHRSPFYKKKSLKNKMWAIDQVNFRKIYLENLKKCKRWKKAKYIRRYNHWSRFLKIFRIRSFLKIYRRKFRIFQRKFFSDNKIEKLELKEKTIKKKNIRRFRKKFTDNLGYLKWNRKRKKRFLKRWRWLIHKKLFKPRKKRWILKKKLPSLEKKYVKILKRLRKRSYNLKASTFLFEKPSKKIHLDLRYRSKIFKKKNPKYSYLQKYYRKLASYLRGKKKIQKKKRYNPFNVRKYFLNKRKIARSVYEKNPRLASLYQRYQACVNVWLKRKILMNPDKVLSRKLQKNLRSLRVYKRAWLYRKNVLDISNRRSRKRKRKTKLERLFKRSFFRKLAEELPKEYAITPFNNRVFCGPFLRRYTPFLFQKDVKAKTVRVNLTENKYHDGFHYFYNVLQNKDLINQKKNWVELGGYFYYVENYKIKVSTALKLKRLLLFEKEQRILKKTPDWLSVNVNKDNFDALKPIKVLYSKNDLSKKSRYLTPMSYRGRSYRSWFKQGLFINKRRKKGAFWKPKLFNKNYLRHNLASFFSIENWKERAFIQFNLLKGKHLVIQLKPNPVNNFIIYKQELHDDVKQEKFLQKKFIKIFSSMNSFMLNYFTDWKWKQDSVIQFKKLIRMWRNKFSTKIRKKKKRSFNFRIRNQKSQSVAFVKRYPLWRNTRKYFRILKRWSTNPKRLKNNRKFKKLKKLIRYEHLTKVNPIKKSNFVKKFIKFRQKVVKIFPDKLNWEKFFEKRKRTTISSVKKAKKWKRNLIPFKVKNVPMYRSDQFRRSVNLEQTKLNPNKIQFNPINPLSISNYRTGMGYKRKVKSLSNLHSLDTKFYKENPIIKKDLKVKINYLRSKYVIKHILGIPLDLNQIFLKKESTSYKKEKIHLSNYLIKQKKKSLLENLFDDDPYTCNSNAKLRAWFLLGKSWEKETLREKTLAFFLWKVCYSEIYKKNFVLKSSINEFKFQKNLSEKFLLQKLNLDLVFDSKKNLKEKKLKFERVIKKTNWSNFWEKDYQKNNYWIDVLFKERGFQKINPEYYNNLLFYKELAKNNFLFLKQKR